MERQTIAAGGEVAVADEVFGGIGIGARRQKDGGDNREKRDCQGCTNPVSETRLGVWQPHGDFDDEWLRRLLRREGFTAQQVRTWKSPPNGRGIITFACLDSVYCRRDSVRRQNLLNKLECPLGCGCLSLLKTWSVRTETQ